MYATNSFFLILLLLFYSVWPRSVLAIIFKVTNLEKHQAFTGMWGQGKISVTGTIDILNIKTQEQVCSIFIDGYGASKDFNVTDGIGKCFKALGKDMTKLK